MKAMILAAGLGTRLRPLTLVRPKALIPVRGLSVLEFWIRRLHQSGFEAVVVNAFHLHEALVEWVARRDWPLPVRVLVESELLGTGGGIRNALDFFNDSPFLVVNGDIICDAPLDALQRQYEASGAKIALLLHDCEEFNVVAVDPHGAVQGFGRGKGSLDRTPDRLAYLAFTGIYFLRPETLWSVPRGEFYDVLDVFRQAIGEGDPPQALRWAPFFWREMGTIPGYLRLHEDLANLEADSIPFLNTGSLVWADSGATVSAKAAVKGWGAIGRRSRLLPGAQLERSVLWENVELRPGSHVIDCVVTDGVVVEGFHEGEVITA